MYHPWNTERPFNDYSSYVRGIFGQRVQKLSLDAGFTCPNRDGTKGRKGCTYCNNNTFNPSYCKPAKSITQQLEEGAEFFKRKGKNHQFFAYFQAYTNTYADIEILRELYEEALAFDGVVGLVVSTRPDCINEEKINYLSELAKKHYISLEYGVESFSNTTLDNINRCHTVEETISAFDMSKDKGLHLGAHLIFGLPGDTRASMIQFALHASRLPIQLIKMHQLQIVKGSPMYKQYFENPDYFDLFEVDEYIELMANFVERLRTDIVIERFTSESPADLLVAPKWGLKNFEFTDKLEKRMKERETWQGKYYREKIMV